MDILAPRIVPIAAVYFRILTMIARHLSAPVVMEREKSHRTAMEIIAVRQSVQVAADVFLTIITTAGHRSALVATRREKFPSTRFNRQQKPIETSHDLSL